MLDFADWACGKLRGLSSVAVDRHMLKQPEIPGDYKRNGAERSGESERSIRVVLVA